VTTLPAQDSSASLATLLCLLLASILLIPLDNALFGISLPVRIAVGSGATLAFIFFWTRESPERKRRYLALAVALLILVVAPISTSLEPAHILWLGLCFLAVLVIPALILRKTGIITFHFWPKHLDWVDVGYTLLSIPLAWGAFELYFKALSPEVPFNWVLGAEPNNAELFTLFMGINAVGIWDELFFVNTSFAILRSLFPFRVANLAQSVIYMIVLYDMAFTGWGPVFVYTLALTQGFMFERSKVLLWVLIVHLIVDYFLFQGIVTRYYPALDVWWH
jgi:membrane protease YdiL (CAAX protease family)